MHTQPQPQAQPDVRVTPPAAAPGVIALVGSGEYLPVMVALEGALLAQGVQRAKQNIYVQLPTAAGRESAQCMQYRRNLGHAQAERLGARCLFLPVYTRAEACNPQWVEALASPALINLSGGDPAYLVQALAGTPL